MASGARSATNGPRTRCRMPVWAEYLMSNVHGQLDSAADEEEGAAAAAAAAEEETAELSDADVERLLAQLPGVQRLIARKAAAVERDPESISTGESLLLAAPEQLDEWDLRAVMEKRRRKERETAGRPGGGGLIGGERALGEERSSPAGSAGDGRRGRFVSWYRVRTSQVAPLLLLASPPPLHFAAWLKERAKVGRATTLGADWRTDVRCRDTGDPTDPVYLEWTSRQIWDLVTMGGKGADPRSVHVRVEDPGERADLVADGAQYTPEMHEWLAELGKIIDEEEEAAITDKDGEVALLAAEFSGAGRGGVPCAVCPGAGLLPLAPAA